MLKMIDVSLDQGLIDWSKVATDGIRGAYLKCSEGMTYHDARFAQNVAAARAAGLVIGCYNVVWFLPGNDPRKQAEAHFATSAGLGQNAGELPPVMDLEEPAPADWVQSGVTGASIRNAALEYLDRALEVWGCLPVVYSYPDFWNRIAGQACGEFATYSRWATDYSNQSGWPSDGAKPAPLAPWGDVWSLWQFSGGGAYMLANGAKCDTSIFNGDEAALQAFCSRTRV
jgi:lysozyme